MEINRRIFKTYDIRGIYPSELNEKIAYLIGKTCATYFKPGIFVMAFDARLSSKKLHDYFLKGFKEKSKDLGKRFSIKSIGLSTTPMFYFTVNKLKASGGAIATASHNPKEYGGFKIVNKGAKMISGKEIERLINRE